jgi:hypothetical protein
MDKQQRRGVKLCELEPTELCRFEEIITRTVHCCSNEVYIDKWGDWKHGEVNNAAKLMLKEVTVQGLVSHL